APRPTPCWWTTRRFSLTDVSGEGARAAACAPSACAASRVASVCAATCVDCTGSRRVHDSLTPTTRALGEVPFSRREEGRAGGGGAWGSGGRQAGQLGGEGV